MVLQKRAPEGSFDLRHFLTTTGAGRSLVEFKKGSIIFDQGAKGDAVFSILKGRVRVSVLSQDGREATIALLGVGDFVGEECVAESAPMRGASAESLTDCTLMRIERETMIKFIHNEPALAESFFAYLLARNSRVQADLIDQLFNSTEKRLARVLLLLANFGKPGEPDKNIPSISQEDLAEMIGSTRSRVNVFMNGFRKQGFIEYNGEIIIHSSLLNVILR